MTSTEEPMRSTEESMAGSRKPEPLAFRTHGFEPRPWERERIHRYSVRRPLWWQFWLKLRELGAKVGIR